jgi:hypothetical protein
LELTLILLTYFAHTQDEIVRARVLVADPDA